MGKIFIKSKKCKCTANYGQMLNTMLIYVTEFDMFYSCPHVMVSEKI